MRHRVAHRKLGRVTEHRIAMLRSQASALIEHEHLQTTVAKAKELRPFVEHIITVAKRSLSAASGSSHHVNARRMVARDIHNRAVVTKLFDEIAPRFAERAGGYTRLMRTGYRRGDSAETAQVELLGSEYDPNVKAAGDKKNADGTPEAPKKKGVGARLREALGGRKKDETAGGKGGKVDKSAKGAGRKVTTPRKAGGGG